MKTSTNFCREHQYVSHVTNFIAYLYFLYHVFLHRVPKKLSRFVCVRTSSNFHQFDNFWHKDAKQSIYMRGALIFHLT